MAAVAPRNYLQKIDEFSAHWALVNAFFGLGGMVLSGGYSVLNLATDRASLATQITALQALINTHEGSASDRDVMRATLREKFRQFNQLARGAFPGAGFLNMLPRIPNFTSAPGVWMEAMADMSNVWTQINALPISPGQPIPMVLSGGYTLANFTTAQAALNTQFTTVDNAILNVSNGIVAREAVWNPIYERLKQYRLQVQGRFAAGAPLLLSLPSLTPAPGHTPTAVNISALWDGTLLKAVVTYTASADPGLASYELRACFGGTRYNTATESVIATHAAGDLTPFQTDDGLVASGSKVYYKVYVILTTGNEKGSRAVPVTRP